MKSIFILCIALLPISSYSQESNFQYEDCSCAVLLDLKIHNGLYGPYGGQRISDSDEEIKGAVTVANLNDTDGDLSIDKFDTNVKTSIEGRSEVDLMRLEISSLKGVVPSKCPTLELVTQGPIELWKSSEKSQVQNKVINLSSLPLTIWVEAQDVSSSVRDIKIEAIVDSEIKDVVKATAIWVQKASVYTPTGIRQMTPDPTNLGIDEMDLLTLINFFGEADDNSRYGFGEFDPNDAFFPPQFIQPRFGGRILFEYELLPNGIESELSSLGISFDITRRLEKDNVSVAYNSSTVTTEVDAFPIKVEEPNDDSVDTDEDLNPSSKQIFSYDAPSERTEPTARAFSVRRLKFEEFVRVSFGSIITGETTQGSKCSQNYEWELNYGLKSESTNPMDPYDPNSQVLKQTQGGGTMMSVPRRLVGNGNGSINLNPSSSILTYLLEFSATGDQWFLKNRANNNIVESSTISTTGPWDFTNGSVSQGNIPFSSGTLFLFNVWEMPQVTNTLTAN